MTKKGFNVLTKIVENFGAPTISYVITEKDLNINNDFFADINNYCKKQYITVYKRTEKNLPTVKYKIAISWKWLIKDSSNLIVLHDSILPKYRGFNPLVTALINGDNEIGVTALYAQDEADTGDIIGISSVTINYPIKINEAINIINTCYTDLIINIIDKIKNKIDLPSIPQKNENASLSLWRDDLDYHINWNDSSENIKRFIDAVGIPYKGAYSIINHKKVRVYDSKFLPDINIVNRTPGKILKIIDGLPVIVCNKGLIQLTNLLNDDGTDFSISSLRTRFL
jgi:methionyl-tRNA formyltransferase